MQNMTSIDHFGLTIASVKDDSLNGLTFYGNKKVYFLPINLAKSFPKLVAYGADECSIKIISKDNFKALNKLTYLGLQDNFIERIQTNTFEDLTSLEGLTLSE